MKDLLKNGYDAKKRPSGHDISEKFSRDNGAAIPPNLIAVANTDSNSQYLRFCKELGISAHPARFPAEIPEYFIRMLTDCNDLVVDPFAGSCVVGEVAERLERNWICCELVEEYVRAAMVRFDEHEQKRLFADQKAARATDATYKLSHPAAAWNGLDDEPLPVDGGRVRQIPGKAGRTRK
jgi:site-specific DNA-methyltransferase (cytosine-N4-specific)